jgi:hypothetical protein
MKQEGIKSGIKFLKLNYKQEFVKRVRQETSTML